MQAFRMTKPAKAKKIAKIEQIEEKAPETGDSGLVIVEEPTAEIIQITQGSWKNMTESLEILEAKVKHMKTQAEQKDKTIAFNKEMNDGRAKMLADTMLKQKILEQELDRLNNVLNVSHQCSDTVVPTDFTARMVELEKETGRFTKPVEITVARAYEVEAVYSQTLGIALGREASVLYATTRYSIYDKFPNLTEAQQNVKKICSTNNIYKEFADLNALIRELMLTGRNDKKWTMNYRDGLYTLAR